MGLLCRTIERSCNSKTAENAIGSLTQDVSLVYTLLHWNSRGGGGQKRDGETDQCQNGKKIIPPKPLNNHQAPITSQGDDNKSNGKENAANKTDFRASIIGHGSVSRVEWFDDVQWNRQAFNTGKTLFCPSLE